MKTIVFTCLLAVALARPDYGKQETRSDHSVEEILRDDRYHPEDGKYSFDFETEGGIKVSESGNRLASVENNPTGQQGTIQFTFPNGEEFSLKYVADENGFQPESDWLPVAPAFPHEIPQFVLDQIEKAAREDAGANSASSEVQRTYKAPSKPKQTYSF